MNRIFSGFIVTMSVLASNQVVRSQDYYNFAQFYVNPSLINPSFTGIDGQPAAFLSYKKQWVGMAGTPSVGNFSVQAPLPTRLSVGLNLANDIRGLVNTSSILFSSSYYIPVSTDMFFRFGFSLGGAWNKVDINSLNFGSTGDDVLTSLLSNNFTPLGNTGISLHSKTFHAGVSVPNIFQPAFLSKDAFTITKVKPFESIIFQTSYRLYFNQGLHIFEPHLLYRLNSSLPSQLEAAGVLHLSNVVWLGGSYKQNYGISALAGFKFNKLTGVGYSYTMKNVGINELNRPSHEIQLAMLFGVHKKKTPMYSFVNSEMGKAERARKVKEAYVYAKNHPKNNYNSKPASSNKSSSTSSKPSTAAPVKTTTNAGPRNRTSDAMDDDSGMDNTNNQQTTGNQTKENLTESNQTTVKQTTTEQVKSNQTKSNQTVKQNTSTQTNSNQTTTTTGNQTKGNQTVSTQTTGTQTTARQTTGTQTTTDNQTKGNQTVSTQNKETQTIAKQTTGVQTTTGNQTKETQTTGTQTTTDNQTKETQTKSKETQVTETKVTDDKTTTDGHTQTFATEADKIQHEEEQERIKRLTEHSDNPTEEHTEESTIHAERHEFVKRGDHTKEMDLGDYVIVGVFKGEANAKHITDELRKLGFSEVDYGYLTNKAVWYVHIAGSNDIEEAKTKRNKYRKMKMFKDAWLLTVHQ